MLELLISENFVKIKAVSYIRMKCDILDLKQSYYFVDQVLEEAGGK